MNMDGGQKFDPVTPGIKDSVRPGFLGGGDDKSSKKAEANNTAASDLGRAEEAASGGLDNSEGDLDSTRKNEKQPGGLYRVARKTLSAAAEARKGNKKGALKKGGPILGIFAIIFVFGGAVAGMQMFMPFSLVAQLQETFNSMHTSAWNRSARLIRWQMDTGRLKNPIKGTLFGSQKFVLSKKQIAEFEKQGIKYDENFEGTGERVLKYKTESGAERIVAVDNNAVKRLEKKGIFSVDGDRFIHTFDSALHDSTFQQKFTAGAKTWRGHFANWFGTKTGEFLKNNKLTRNMFQDFDKKKAEAEANGKTALEAVKETIAEKIKGGGEGGGVSRKTEKDEDGKRGNSDSRNSKINASNVKSKLNDISGKISGGANLVCAATDFIGVVSLMVVADQVLQILNVTTAYMEGVDKTKAGYGEQSPINELATSLNEQRTINHEKIVQGDGGTFSEGGETLTMGAKPETVVGNLKSAMQSAGVAAIYGSGIVDPNDASVQSFNLTGSMMTLLGGLGMGVSSFEACTLARAAVATASIASDVVLCLVSACVGTLVKHFVLGLGTGLLLTGIIAVITPWVVNAMSRDLIAELAGEDLGNAIVSGGNMYQGFVHKTNGGSLATPEKYQEFAVVQRQVIAEEARQERAELSPFDMTSKNTFMGTLATQLMSFNTSNSLMSTLTSASSVMSSSLSALTPSSSAIALDIKESLPTIDEYKSVAPYLASIGAIGDSYGNPYMITDMSTMDLDIADVVDYLYNSGQLEDGETSDGNVILKKNSEVLKYQLYCGERTSAFGVADMNIANSFRVNFGNTVVDTALGVAPILGDLIDIFEAPELEANIGYISGEACVAGNTLDRGSTPRWNKAKIFQRFIEDQSLLESMGLIKESAVSAAMREYYEEHPLDNTYEGQLARYSGLDKETVSDMLDIIAYYNYINNYNPSERYAFGDVEIKVEDDSPMFDNENILAGDIPLLENIVYADVRNRNFAV